jgi:hypothetical protein
MPSRVTLRRDSKLIGDIRRQSLFDKSPSLAGLIQHTKGRSAGRPSKPDLLKPGRLESDLLKSRPRQVADLDLSRTLLTRDRMIFLHCGRDNTIRCC